MLVKLNGEFFTKSRDEIDLWWFIFHLGQCSYTCVPKHITFGTLRCADKKLILPLNKSENFENHCSCSWQKTFMQTQRPMAQKGEFTMIAIRPKGFFQPVAISKLHRSSRSFMRIAIFCWLSDFFRPLSLFFQ
jgi:hypothetical protein